jgi:hypothetical protein
VFGAYLVFIAVFFGELSGNTAQRQTPQSADISKKRRHTASS